MKKIITTFLFLGICTETMAYSIPWETISGSKSSNGFSWNYSYDIGFFNDALMIDLDLNLVGDSASQTLLDRWEQGIEEIWSTDRFEIPILFNVDWVSENYDQTVNIHAGNSNTFNMLNWNTIGANGWGDAYQEEIVAHEAGHMFGLWDEYAGGAVDPVSGLIKTNGLMHTLNGDPLDYYYDEMLNWHLSVMPVPTPAAAWLFGSGLIGLIGLRKKEIVQA